MMIGIRSYFLLPHNTQQWRITGIFCALYFSVSLISAHLIPASLALYPASAIALCAIFFAGPRISIALLFTIMLSEAYRGGTFLDQIAFSTIITIQSLVGAYALHISRVDPLFRKLRDVSSLIIVVSTISLVEPTLHTLWIIITVGQYSLALWIREYVASFFIFFIITPFLLRWYAKPRFRRTREEVATTIGAFALLAAIDALVFITHTISLSGVPLMYGLLFPLSYIALRLRPRFVTLSLLLTSITAVAGVVMGTSMPSEMSELMRTEIFLIALSGVFYIITSIKEESRVSASTVRSQLATLENAMARVSSESRSKSDFIAMLGHEIRNPLAAILMGIELLKLKSSVDSEGAKVLDMMMERVDFIRRLLDDLLDISKITEGKVTFTHEVVDLRDALVRAVLSTAHHRDQLHQQIVFNRPTVHLYVRGDAVRLEQIFSNLLTNASRYSNPGDTVRMQIVLGDGKVQVRVTDEGFGISPDALETIFIPFHQLHQTTESAKGLGIGLSLVQSFVHMHDGSVIASSEGLGKGSTFTVTLPLCLEGVNEENPDNSLQESPVDRSQEKLTLVIDGGNSQSGTIGRLLELSGSAVIYAYDMQHAIKQATSQKPAVVIVDLDQPLNNDDSGATMLRASGYKGRIIGLTEQSSPLSAEVEGRQQRCDILLSKPIELSALKRALVDPI